MENDNKKVKQVGNLTFGILLIVLGVIFLISMFTEPTWLMHAIDLWPIFLITLGAETLFYSEIKGYTLKWNFWNVIFIGIILIASLFIGICGSMIRFASQDENIQNKAKEIVYRNLDIELDENDLNE